MASIDDLKEFLLQDIRQLQKLADTLRSEKACLSMSDLPALETLTAEKNRLLDEVRERAKLKIHTLVAMGYKPDSGEPSRFILSAGFVDTHNLWKQADTHLRECLALNQSNGRVIVHLQKRLSRLTDIFRGTAGQQKLYGAKGEHTNISSRTILASA